jgi:hypothetical protein
MAACRQEVRRLEEKINGFELHHILQRDNESADALARVGSSWESPPPSIFVQDLFKPSIRLEEDAPTILPGTSPSEGALVSVISTPQGRRDPTVTLGACP